MIRSEEGYAQTKILHYTETSGFDHQTRQASYSLFNQLAALQGYSVDDDSTGDSFNSLAALQSYEVIVFSNTTGDAILDPAQRFNFEQYIAGGGNVIGIHSATDTYRHSSANGTNTGTWDFFPELLGASVRQNPSHVNGTPVFTMTTVQSHPLLTGIPSPWMKAEEYYYWEAGYFDTTNNILFQVEQTGTASYDSSRATTWYRENGTNRIFCTSLGHLPSDFVLDTLFRKLISNALQWTTSGTLQVGDFLKTDINIFPNPVLDHFTVSGIKNGILDVYSIEGRKMLSLEIKKDLTQYNIESLPAGYYVFKFNLGDHASFRKVIGIIKKPRQ